MRVWRTSAQFVSWFQLVRAQVHWHIWTHLHCCSLLRYREIRVPESFHFTWQRKFGCFLVVWARWYVRWMVTVGESPVKRVKKTHRGRRSSSGQKRHDQRNEKYYPGSFAFAWLVLNYGTANCNVAPTSDGKDRSIETERGIVGASETIVGSPQDSWADVGRANEADGSECERYVSSWWQYCGHGARGTWSWRWTIRIWSVCGEISTRELQLRRHWMAWLVSGVSLLWAGRFQRGWVLEIIRFVEPQFGDEATVTELDLRLDEWASAELKSVAADFCHALILFCKGKVLKNYLDQQRGRRMWDLASAGQQVRADQQSECGREVAKILRTPFDGDFLDAITTFESRETINASFLEWARTVWKNILQRSATRQLDEFGSRDWVDWGRKKNPSQHRHR